MTHAAARESHVNVEPPALIEEVIMRFWSILLPLLLLSAACAPDCPVGTSDDEAGAEVVVLAMIEAINARDFEALDTLVADDVRRHSVATPGVQVTSLEDFKAFLNADLTAVPDFHQEVNRIFSSGGMVATHVTYSGTQSGQMGPFPPSGLPFEIPFIGLLRVDDGKVAEIWVEWDNLAALTQLGHVPAPDMWPVDDEPVAVE